MNQKRITLRWPKAIISGANRDFSQEAKRYCNQGIVILTLKESPKG